jgi:GxxExxY protein
MYIKKYLDLTEREEELATEVVDIAYCIHKELGPGLLESIYETCFCYELSKRNIEYKRQHSIDIEYDGLKLDSGLRIDIIVENLLIIELKAQENVHPVWEAQILSHLKLTQKRIGFLINFHVQLIKQGIKRYVY